MHTQPRAAMVRARARYCCWLPPQPCTKSTPGLDVCGATTVPSMCSSSTAMSTASWRVAAVSSRIAMAIHHAVFEDPADPVVDPVEIDGRAGGRLRAVIGLDRRCPHRAQGRVGAKGLERRHLGAACPADAP